MKTSKAKYNFIQSVDRALQILEVFSNKEKELGVTDISKALNLHKSTAFGLLATLERRGYVEQNQENGKYRLGLKLFELGNLVQAGMDLRVIALPYISELVEKYGETVHLVIYDNGQIVYIDKMEGSSSIRIISQIGKRLPMHCTGVGKCILAHLPEMELERIIEDKGLPPFTSRTITEREKLNMELEQIRKSGYAFDMEEIEDGLRCVAAPILNHKNEVIAAISLSGPSMRLTKEVMKKLIDPVKSTALKISEKLGYRGI